MLTFAREQSEIIAAMFRLELAAAFQYRVRMMINFLYFVAEPIIYVVVWQTVAQQSGGEVSGFTVAEFAAYFIAWTFVRHLTAAWGVNHVENNVRRGTFSMLLLRPSYPWLPDLMRMVSHKVVGMFAVVPTILLMALIFRPRFDVTLTGVILFVPAVVAGFLLRYVLSYALALIAFYTTRIGWVGNLWLSLEFFTSGRIAPLDLLPEWAYNIVSALPFRWMFYFPLETLLGRLTFEEIVRGFAIQLGWLAFSILLFNVNWRRGIRRYTAVGG